VHQKGTVDATGIPTSIQSLCIHLPAAVMLGADSLSCILLWGIALLLIGALSSGVSGKLGPSGSRQSTYRIIVAM